MSLANGIRSAAEQVEALELENRHLRFKLKVAESKVRALEAGVEPEPEAESPWAVLGLREGASLSEVQAAFRRLSLECHPDTGGDPDRFQRVLEARDQLVAK